MALSISKASEKISKNSVETVFSSAYKFTLFVPSTLNVLFVRQGKRVIQLGDNRQLSEIRKDVMDNLIEELSNTMGGVSLLPDHVGAWFDSDTGKIVTEVGTQIVVIVPNTLKSVKFYDHVTKKSAELSPAQYFVALAKELRDTFNQDSVLLTAEPIFALFVS